MADVDDEKPSPVNVMLSPSVKAELKAAAVREQRTLAGQIRWILDQWLQAQRTRGGEP